MSNTNKHFAKKHIEKHKVHLAINLFFNRTKAIYDYKELHAELLLFIGSINQIANKKNNVENALEQGFLFYLQQIEQPKKRSIEAILNKSKPISNLTKKPSFIELVPLWIGLKDKGYSLRKISKYTLNHAGVTVSKTTIGNYIKKEKDI